jgi:2-polyprenyl-3-methyl-5-hydroxy-6-metoxy-1,4-benzoquinol methylase
VSLSPRPPIRSRPVPQCPLCGKRGQPLYQGLGDRFERAPERWSLSRCVDPECALLWLDPMPVEEDIAQAYHADYYTHQDVSPPLTWYRRAFRWLKRGYLAARYGYRTGTTPRWQRLLGLSLCMDPRRRADVDASVMHLTSRPGGRLLEVGCGGGVILRNLRDVGWDVEGVDFDGRAVANARSKGLNVHQGPLDAQAFEDGRFHAIVLSHVLEHVHDPRGLLAECFRVLHPEGTMIVLTPNAGSLGHRIFGASWFPLEPPRHLHVFNPRNLRKLAQDAGFSVSRLETRRREGWLIWRCSRQIRASGRAEPFAPRTLAERAGGLLFEAAEGALLAVRPFIGEEILLQGGHSRGSARQGVPI